MEDQAPIWDTFVDAREWSSVYQLSGWSRVIRESYGHDVYYLMKTNGDATHFVGNESPGVRPGMNQGGISNAATMRAAGILPLVHIRSALFGNSLTSIPYFDHAGILAENLPVEKELLQKAVELAKELGSTNIELRHLQPLAQFDTDGSSNPKAGIEGSRHLFPGWRLTASFEKVRMLLDLPDNTERLMKSFKSKLRSQIRKPMKEGLTVKRGKAELLADFYNVFSVNMRDLGSPVHSRRLFVKVLQEFPETARLFVVYHKECPIACSLVLGFKDVLSNPWASSLRSYSHLAPNMLLYWSMLEFGCETGYRVFDFGRSTPNESTYKFKEQWGARPHPLYWYRLSRNGIDGSSLHPEKQKMTKAIEYWKKLPVPLTQVIGPYIRKYISL